MKELRCRDAGFDCDTVLRGDSNDEVMAQARAHAHEAHGVEVTPEMREQLTPLVQES